MLRWRIRFDGCRGVGNLVVSMGCAQWGFGGRTGAAADGKLTHWAGDLLLFSTSGVRKMPP